MLLKKIRALLFGPDEDRQFSEDVTRYYWDVKTGLTEEEHPHGVPCYACGAGRHQPCFRTNPFADLPVQWCHLDRQEYLDRVHEDFLQMDGRS